MLYIFQASAIIFVQYIQILISVNPYLMFNFLHILKHLMFFYTFQRLVLDMNM